jgi:4-hydroxy-3-polyprenylbenzoate decarboxylase
MPGVVALQTTSFRNYEETQTNIDSLNEQLASKVDQLKEVALIVICDDASFTAASIRNYVWVTYTRCNPSHDIYGIKPFTRNKHWGCEGPMIIDARIKPHHAPPLEPDPVIEKNIDRLFAKGGSLYGIA